MKHLSKPWILTTTLILTTPLLFGCNDTNIEEKADEVIRPAKIATVVSAAGCVQRSFPAQVSANASTSLAFRVPVQITKRYVTEGKRVEAETLIAQLDPTDFNIHLDDASAKHELAVAQHERNTTLVPKGLATQAEFDTSRAEMLMAKANLDRATQNLKYTKIYAPYDGVVAQNHSEDYDHVAATQLIFEFKNNITVTPDMPWYALVCPGMPRYRCDRSARV